jgi:hypothetical protein
MIISALMVANDVGSQVRLTSYRVGEKRAPTWGFAEIREVFTHNSPVIFCTFA